MRLIFIFLLCLLAIQPIFSQNKLGLDKYTPGYIVLSEGDTLHGQVSYVVSNNFYKSVLKFKSEEFDKKLKFNPYEVTAFNISDREFHSIRVSDGGFVGKVWMELIIDGPLKLYKNHISDIYIGSVTNYSKLPVKSIHTYLVKENEEKAFNIDWGRFKKTVSKYLKDDPEISEKIKSETYVKKDIEQIVIEYNQHIKSKL